MFYIFDKDGTVVRSKAGNPFATTVEDQEVIPGVMEKLQDVLLNDDNTIFAIATNQGGVAFGQLSIEDAAAITNDAAKKIGATLGVFDPNHPEGNVAPYNVESDTRKPAPGMLTYLMNEVGAIPEETVMVGDGHDDRLAAEAAGVRFEWAKDFFDWE